ncbi:toll/interleukin-1 receptor domain-containing protein [Aquimarina litoralis]|uniref:toll/interleukin-1 receptor domain-containing protein n=1 Tax=Aquimarina litoralis TaxID=584605 RepID=UPI001C59E4A8|nr:toll/interleukin-1 receptor domain-containing protein [Aquimarina litoralis]MBW1298113.1 TIR domain-containing protein [Aquimarina litoralis]
MAKKENKCSVRFESIKIDSVYEVLDALSWLDEPDMKQIAQFSGIDPRTAGKVLKNCVQIGIVKEVTSGYFVLTIPYPYKGSKEQKEVVLKEAIFRMPLISSLRQFLKVGEILEDALRKAATVQKIENYDKSSIDPLIKWATKLNTLSMDLQIDDFADEGLKHKESRHQDDSDQKVVFLSHSSKDKSFIRQLTADLTSEGILVWLDEQQINVGDSINKAINQGLAESDYFVIAMSDNSVKSEWVERELNSALIDEIEEKKVKVLPIKLSECTFPLLIKDKKYADFTKHYKQGLQELIKAIKNGK